MCMCVSVLVCVHLCFCAYVRETERETCLPTKPSCLCSLISSVALLKTKTRGIRGHNDMDIAAVTSLVALCDQTLWSLRLGSVLTALLAVVKSQKIWIWPVRWSPRGAGVGSSEQRLLLQSLTAWVFQTHFPQGLISSWCKPIDNHHVPYRWRWIDYWKIS